MLGESETARKVGWETTFCQQERFKVLCEIGNLNYRSILDIGCGLGDLKIYLDKHFQDFHYTGIDLMPEFIEEARKRFSKTLNTQFLLDDFTVCSMPQADYVLACGALCYRTVDELFIYKMIEKFYKHATMGLAFNLLDEETTNSDYMLKTYKQQDVLDFCIQLNPNATLITGYRPDDFTILMTK